MAANPSVVQTAAQPPQSASSSIPDTASDYSRTPEALRHEERLMEALEIDSRAQVGQSSRGAARRLG